MTALDRVKSILEVVNKNLQPFPAHGHCSSETRVWDYFTPSGVSADISVQYE